MRRGMSCVVCAETLPEGVRADCRHCSVRCRMRAYRIRCDSGGCLRSDAQRRQLRTIRQDARTRRDAEHQERQALTSERDTLAGQLADAQAQHRHVAAYVVELEKKLAQSQQDRATWERLCMDSRSEAAELKERLLALKPVNQGLIQRVTSQQRTINALEATLEAQSSQRGSRRTGAARGNGRQAATAGTSPYIVMVADGGPIPAAAAHERERERAKLQADLDRTAQALRAEQTQTAHLSAQLATYKRTLATAENTVATLRQELTAQERDITEARQAVDVMQARLTEQAAQHASRDEEREWQIVRYARDITALQGKLEAAEKSAQFWKDPQVMLGVVSAIKAIGGVTEDLVRQHYDLPPKERANPAQPQAISVSVSPPGTAPSPASSPSVAPPTTEQARAPKRPFTDENGKNLYHPYNKTNTLIGQAKARREGR